MQATELPQGVFVFAHTDRPNLVDAKRCQRVNRSLSGHTSVLATSRRPLKMFRSGEVELGGLVSPPNRFTFHLASVSSTVSGHVQCGAHQRGICGPGARTENAGHVGDEHRASLSNG